MSGGVAGEVTAAPPVVARRGSVWGRPLFLLALAQALAVCVGRWVGVPLEPWILLASGGGLLVVISLGVFWQSSGIFARPLLGVETPWPEVAITFDDGPNPAETPAILKTLEARGHLATFFVIGLNAQRHPELLAEIVRGGHGLANHSLAHSWFTNLLPPRQLAEDLRRTNAALSSVTGKPPRFFRAPVGLLSPRIARAAELAQLDLVGWTANARDGAPWRTAAQGIGRLHSAIAPGSILVLHDGARALGRPGIARPILHAVLDEMERKGLRSVTLDRLLRL